MKKIVTILLLFTLCNVSAQDEECGVTGTFELPDNFSVNTNRSLSRIMPISVWIAQGDNGVGGIQIQSIYDELDIVNAHYNGSIQFEICSVGYVQNDDYYNLKNNGYRWYTENNNPNTMNIYFVNSLTIGGSSYCGYAYYPSSSVQRILMRNSCTTNGSTLSHEIGHYMGMYHTHQDSDRSNQELVDGSNCSTNGDRFCSTPADPRLSNSNTNTDCEYTGNATDLNGDVYAPSTTNIMSYSRKSCRTEFTDEQLQYVESVYDNYHSEYSCQTLSIPKNDIQKIKIYPNPFNDKISISVESSYKLYDLNGRIVKFGIGTELRTNDINKGIYILKIVYDDRVLHIKVIK